MAKFEIDITKRLLKTLVVEVPDDVPEEELKEWVWEFVSELYDDMEMVASDEWDVSDLVEGRTVVMKLTSTIEDHEYDVEGFKALKQGRAS